MLLQGHLHYRTLSVGLGSIRQDLDKPYRGRNKIENPEGRRTLQHATVLTADYALAERWSLGLFVPYRWSETRGRIRGSVRGFGDAGFNARYAVNQPHTSSLEVHAMGSVSFPTGKVETAFLDQNIVLGVGAPTLGAGVEAAFAARDGGRAFTRLLGSRPIGASDAGVRFGGALSTSAGYGRAWVAGGRSRWALSAAAIRTGADRDGSVPNPNRGGRRITATAGSSFPAGPSSEVTLGIERLVSADLRGDQLAATWSGFLGLRWTHPELGKQ